MNKVSTKNGMSKMIEFSKQKNKFMKTIFDKRQIINYEKIEKDFSKHQLVEDLARARMEGELWSKSFCNLQREIQKLVNDGYLKFDKEFAEADNEYFPTIFKALENYHFLIEENGRVFDRHNGKYIYWEYLDKDGIKIPPIKPYEERVK